MQHQKIEDIGKINFTPTHFERMKELAVEMLLDNEVISNRLGLQLNIVELIHTTTISTLNSLRVSMAKAIENLENADEWVDSANQEKIEKLKKQKELVNLIIGYKRYLLEQQQTSELKKQLKKTLEDLKESQKTPEDKIKEIEAQLAELG